MKKILLAILPLAILASCGSKQERKVLVVANGTITVQGNNINIGDTSAGASNFEMDIKDVTNKNLNVNNNGVKSSIPISSEGGYYILNLNNKDIYGSQLLEGRDYNNKNDLNLDEQKAMIDSLKQVLAGTNISAANKNYLIKPGQLIELSNDLEHTQVFAPFEPLSDINQPKDGKPVVLFKFYSKDELQSRLQTVEDSYNTPS
ncbi:hypothetical protein [Arachidicoccus soli]|uniref:Uncharacterized protein n=1 Tax=Arachidicoccus soli TaxID=2341117 RepID=A0A386HS16_9BACT|nr:hypothetical protein [Arachidicoccus soli]AYD48482.1 hypothetical protein D6B99_13240 [Arachidicoccus soli]